MNPPKHTPNRVSVPEFCLPATNSGTSLLAHILRSSQIARKRLEAQRASVVLAREEDEAVRSDSASR